MVPAKNCKTEENREPVSQGKSPQSEGENNNAGDEAQPL
jgi:hypothetical protein